MPRDIRSFFITSKPTSSKPEVANKSKKRRIISSDEDEEKKNSPKKRTKLTKKPEKLHDLSESDDEHNVSSSKKKDVTALSVKKNSPKKVTSLLDAFGSNPIKREGQPQITKKLQRMEAEFHNEDDFEETLKQLDTSMIEEDCLPSTEKQSKSPKNTKLHEGKDKSLQNKDEKDKETPVKSSSQNKSISSTHDGKDHASKRKSSSSASCEETPPTKLHKEISKKTKSKNFNIEVTPGKSETTKKPVIDQFEERIEKKKQSAALYQKYLHRGGARNPGSKPIPEGAENCLAGLSFLITGVMESLEREEAEELIKKYGGRILQSVSRKTDYVIVGDEPGPSKLAKADSLHIKKISEDDLLKLISTRPAGKATDIKQSRTKSVDRKASRKSESDDSERMKTEEIPCTSTQQDTEQVQLKEKPTLITHSNKSIYPKTEDAKDIAGTSHSEPKNIIPEQTANYSGTEALVEKYRPKTIKQLVGQQGDKSNAVKLYNWLKNWHNNHKGQTKVKKPSPWDKNDNGAFFKAALLSGPPGIGKTTSVQVVCNELSFDLLEFNASDTRSKKLLKEEVTEIMSNTTMKDYFSGSTAKAPTNKHALLMDEVDGMAGNEDRGGLQELINMIKSTDIPILCICNDRNHPKMRTLANYTYDLRFQKPRLEQIRGAMKSICYKEGIKISTEDLDRLIESTNHDIRQVINHLALFIDKPGQQATTEKKHINKDLKLGPWDVVKQVFSAEEHKSMTIHDKSGLFFHDYSIAPLFVQENYLSVEPSAKEEHLKRIALSAESLALGDTIEAAIRSKGSWSLLPIQAMFSSAIPGSLMSGRITNQINFPSWLGRNSRSNKFDRMRQEITAHARLTTGAGKEAINLDYSIHLRNAITRPLVTEGVEGVEKAVSIMNHYHLLREDLDSLIEISLWPNDRDPMQLVESKVKAAFTRTYNKLSTTVPSMMSSTGSKKKAAQASQDEGFIDDEEEGNNDSDDNDDDLEADKMIKAKKPTATKKKDPKEKDAEKPAKRGRGRGKGK